MVQHSTTFHFNFKGTLYKMAEESRELQNRVERILEEAEQVESSKQLWGHWLVIMDPQLDDSVIRNLPTMF